MQQGLIELWHFDESEGPVALNGVEGGQPIHLHGASREPRRFGGALRLARVGDAARGPAIGRLATGSVAFWLRIDQLRDAVDILNLQGRLQVMASVGHGESLNLLASLHEQLIIAEEVLAPGRWCHVTVTFSPDGLNLYLDGQRVGVEPEVRTGLTPGWWRQNLLMIGPLPAGAGPVVLDELACFSRELSAAEIGQLALGGLEPTDPVKTTPVPRLVDASSWIDRQDARCGLHKAVAALGGGGGVVVLPPGRYAMRAGLELPSNVTLRAVVGGVVLSAAKPEFARLMFSVRAGAEAVEVDEPAIFAPGDAVCIRDANTQPWQATMTHVLAVDGRILRLATPLVGDVSANDAALVLHWFPMIAAVGQHRVHLEGLRIEGVSHAVADEVAPMTQRSCAAICLVDCRQSLVRDCEVEDWPHDGIAIHGGEQVRIDACRVRGCHGHGFRLGAGARHHHIADATASHNHEDGVRADETVRDCVIRTSTLLENSRNGVGVAIDTQGLTLSALQCFHNGRHGIQLEGGQAHVLRDNVCRDNSTAQPGRCAGIRLKQTRQCLLTANRCISSDDPATQAQGVWEADDAESNQVDASNLCLGCSLVLRKPVAAAASAPVVPMGGGPRSRFRRGLEDF